MKKNKNKGFSMVEVLISVTIFSILMIPIVSGIVAALRSSTNNKEIQYRNEFAQHLLEYTKEDSLDNILDGSYFKSVGAYDVKKTSELKDSLDYTDPATHKTKYAPYETYMLEGSMNLGTKNTKYSYKIEISSKEYAEIVKSSAVAAGTDPTKSVYSDPNNVNLGVVEDLDYTKIALINGTIANYDAAVTDAFITRKLQILKDESPEQFNQYVEQAYEFNPFRNDKVKRQIIIAVSGDKTNGYEVVCKLRYTDDSVYTLVDGTSMKDRLISSNKNVIEYVPYSQSFDKLPNIYLMYNVCLYNGFYSDEDYIVLDTSQLALEEEKKIVSNGLDKTINTTTEVNLFVVETASHFSDGVAETLAKMDKASSGGSGSGGSGGGSSESGGTGGTGSTEAPVLDGSEPVDPEIVALKQKYLDKILYDDRNISRGDNRDSVKIYLLASGDCANSTRLANVNVYHNFDFATVNEDNDDDDMSKTSTDYTKDSNGNTRYNTKNQNIFYSGSVPTVELGDKTGSDRICGPLVSLGADGKRNSENSARVRTINKAKQGNRGLYTVKVWMAKGDPDAVDTEHTDPLITGTKGGSELE